MLKKLRPRSGFDAVAVVALFLAVTGPVWADSVANGAASIRKALSKINKRSNTALKTAKEAKSDARRALVKGGPPGATGANGATGAAGAAGKNLVLNTPLASGQTDRGVWAVGGGASDNMDDAIQFHAPLAAALDGAHTIRVTAGSATHCPGPGSAEAGYFCLYERANTATFGSISDPATGTTGVGTLGAQVAYTGSGGNQGAGGTWAVTAP